VLWCPQVVPPHAQPSSSSPPPSSQTPSRGGLAAELSTTPTITLLPSQRQTSIKMKMVHSSRGV
jgi:hypothetical protein